MAQELTVFRTIAGGYWPIGTIDAVDGSFSYRSDYLGDPMAQPISLSLPLQREVFDGPVARPYFEGLLPEGDARRSIAAAIQAREDDYLALLSNYGFDCLGDIVIADHEEKLASSYEPVDVSTLARTFVDDRSMSVSSRASRLSIAGTQYKTGLAHRPDSDMDKGWYRPAGGAASSHILKTGKRDAVLYLEYLCLRAARYCGVHAAETELLDFGRPVICSERYDRIVRSQDGLPSVTRLHQEDFTQAFGLLSGSKYYELTPSSVHVIADFIRTSSDDPIEDLDRFVRLTLFNYMIGNCDNHLKNMSILYSGDWSGIRLAPAYDLVCTTWFPDLSREMGMSLGGVREIDEVTEENIVQFGEEAGYPSRKLARVCHELSGSIGDAVMRAGNEAPLGLDEVLWKAEELLDDMAPRLTILDGV